MAELYQAYGGFGDSGGFGSFEEEDHERKAIKVKEAPAYVPQGSQVTQSSQGQHMPQQPQQHVKEDFSNKPLEYAPIQQQAPMYKRQPTYASPYASYSFGDRMSLKRPEVIKLAMFSLVIVLAIALDRIGTHYLTKYLADNVFTDFQEFILRLSYPIVIFLTLWIVKSL